MVSLEPEVCKMGEACTQSWDIKGQQEQDHLIRLVATYYGDMLIAKTSQDY
jgi:hypothetical protein